MRTTQSFLKPIRLPQAFSLVEVTLALGIFAFALVLLLGLIPIALQASRNALEIATGAQIADALNIQLTDPDSPLRATSSGDWSDSLFFDDLGSETTSESSSVYEAKCFLDSSLNAHLLKVKIAVFTKRPASATEPPSDARYYSQLIYIE